MNQRFQITGMHCQSCVKKLTAAIGQVSNVESVSVTLDPPIAAIEGETIDEHAIITAISLAGDYQAIKTSDQTVTSSTNDSKPSKLATYYPLLLIVSFLIFGCAILQFRTNDWNGIFYMSDFMGGFFVVFAFFKLLDVRGFVSAFQSYDLLAARFRSYGYAYPFIELGLGVAYLMRIEPMAINAIALTVMLVGAAGVLRSLIRKREIQCACLGTVFELPMSTVTLVEDVGMAIMAASMIGIRLAS